MERTIVVVGGTGQILLHYYSIAYLMGVVEKPFQGVIIDTAPPIASLDFLAKFWALVAKGFGAAGLEAIPSIHVQRIEAEQGDEIFEVLTGTKLPTDYELQRHYLTGWFSIGSLKQKSHDGLYGRPALASVMASEAAMQALREIRYGDDARVVLVGSTIGGTGGGLTVPLLSALNAALGEYERTTMRAVLFGPYFEPEPHTIDKERFRSNNLLVLKALAESASKLNRYVYIDGPVMPRREHKREEDGAGIQWPAADEPFWHGTAAIDYLLSDRVLPAPKALVDGEVPAGSWNGGLRHDVVEQRLRDRPAVARALVRHDLVKLLARDPHAEKAYGGLLRLVNEYYAQVGAKQPKTTFCDSVQADVEALWGGRQYGLGKLFPSSDGIAKPAEIPRSRWEKPRDGLDPASFENLSEAHQITAASILNSCLMGAARQ